MEKAGQLTESRGPDLDWEAMPVFLLSWSDFSIVFVHLNERTEAAIIIVLQEGEGDMI